MKIEDKFLFSFDCNFLHFCCVDVCLYEGTTYKQDAVWNVGCDAKCTCENAIYGYYRCVSKYVYHDKKIHNSNCCVRELEERERENCTHLVLKCTAGDCRREDDRSKQFTYLLFKLFATFISYLNQISQLSNLQQFTNWLLPYEESRRML